MKEMSNNSFVDGKKTSYVNGFIVEANKTDGLQPRHGSSLRLFLRHGGALS